MLSPLQLKDIVHSAQWSQRDRALLILAVDDCKPKLLEEIRSLGKCAGISDISKWNLSSIYEKCGLLVARFGDKRELTLQGRQHIRGLAESCQINLVVTTASHALRQHLDLLTDSVSKAFVTEAIVCFEAKQHRAAVVFSWVGAMSLLYQRVVAKHLADFNMEATRREGKKWRIAKNADDLGRMKEHDALDVMECVGMIGKAVKMTLQNHCLQLRNSCGHPNSLVIAENSVAAHIEKLILNVYSKF